MTHSIVEALRFQDSYPVGRWPWGSAQWLEPRICSVNREVGGLNLSMSTDDPLG